MLRGTADDQCDLLGECEAIEIVVSGRLLSPTPIEIEADLTDVDGTPIGIFSPGHDAHLTRVRTEGPFKITRSLRLPRMLGSECHLSIHLIEPCVRFLMNAPNAVRLRVRVPPQKRAKFSARRIRDGSYSRGSRSRRRSTNRVEISVVGNRRTAAPATTTYQRLNDKTPRSDWHRKYRLRA